ncbi:hypothetical protein [Thalassotalea sp. PP2-459]|uniref:hypothetical protein n=1 Tax=Thalassotalea sp. PP2-459 TaxID=1742724 RepID=UPI0009434DFF|nr:hypothetical protein [Thalassotalea sp. PP2-459]OKY25173.1 hypothetical protein BI291_03960 [Thalassotalea sp. PP2-459]
MNRSILFILTVLVLFKANALPNDTENFYLCAGKTTESTTWNFGTAPAFCDISPFGDPKFVDDYLSQIIFNSESDVVVERRRYMNELNAVIKIAAKYYLSVRKPDASNEEVLAWINAIKTVANQETFWSHYFRSILDSKTKMMRGDNGHGHGMMQIDDRWHFTQINEGKGWQIFENMIYAMEIFYAEWQNASEATCVSSANNWPERTRAAYSAYNGGPTKICRWSNNPAWQDDGFLGKFEAESWQLYITDEMLESAIDVECLMEGVEFCLPDYQPPEQDHDTDEQVWWFNFLTLTTGETCLLVQDEYRCVAQEQDAVCLSAMFDRIATASAITLTEQQSQLYPKKIYERHQCIAEVQHGFSVGDLIITAKDINIRHTAAGADTNVDSETGSAYQILDVIVSLAPVQERYYKIKQNTTIGYVFAGDYDTWQDWAYEGDASALDDNNKIIAMSGDTVYVVNDNGLSLLASTQSGAETLATISKDTALTIDDVSIQGASNDVFYHVTNNGKAGVIHAGKLLPTFNLSANVSFTAPINNGTEPPNKPGNNQSSSSSGGSWHLHVLIFLMVVLCWKWQLKAVNSDV